MARDQLFFNTHRDMRAARADVDTERGHLVGDELGQFRFFEVKQIALLHGLQVVQGGFDLTHHHLDIHLGIAHRFGQIFAPDFVRLFVAVASLHAVAKQLTQRLEGRIGVDQIHEAFAAGRGRIGFESVKHDQIILVGDLGKLGIDF